MSSPLKTSRALRVRRYLWDRQAGRCAYCGWIFKEIHDSTIDHVVPRSKGGTNKRSNLRLACISCNQAKADSLPSDPWYLSPISSSDYDEIADIVLKCLTN